MGRRSISWSAAVRDFKDDRATRHEIREERLRTAGAPGMPLSAWRGRSGRRYVVGIHSVSVESFDGQWDAVVIAVHRDGFGNAEIINVAGNVGIGKALDWVQAVRRAGASELHVHRLCDTVKERVEMVNDLTAEVAR